ncbi:hypothetical protein PABY_05950 [Pyrodictium abyssi]|uniref:Uncharacterized protein n=2 Tax=Pyrodictium abyssi TaxID=54256 RepID=A0ABN6ZTM8_9CREN|nr:hypothetical protein PABY_05950 [Pyrodictium abyssi]
MFMPRSLSLAAAVALSVKRFMIRLALVLSIAGVTAWGSIADAWWEITRSIGLIALISVWADLFIRVRPWDHERYMDPEDYGFTLILSLLGLAAYLEASPDAYNTMEVLRTFTFVSLVNLGIIALTERQSSDHQ